MPQMTCYDPCPEIEVLPLPTNAAPQPVVNGGGGGGSGLTAVSTTGTDDVVFSGNGTTLNPLRATFVGPRTIEFEMAIGKLGGATDAEVIAVYIAAKTATLPAGLPGSQFSIEGQVGDVLINIEHNGLIVGAISIVNGVADAANVPEIVLAEGDMLQFISGLNSEFSLLALTILGLRQLEYVA